MRIVVYGTLRVGESRAWMLNELRSAGTSEVIELEGVNMFVVASYPGVILTGNPDDKIVAEVIDATLPEEKENKLIKYLDRIEGVGMGLYKREIIDTPKGPAMIYVYNRKIEKFMPKIGDWMNWIALSDEEQNAVIARLHSNAMAAGVGG